MPLFFTNCLDVSESLASNYRLSVVEHASVQTGDLES